MPARPEKSTISFFKYLIEMVFSAGDPSDGDSVLKVG